VHGAIMQRGEAGGWDEGARLRTRRRRCRLRRGPGKREEARPGARARAGEGRARAPPPGRRAGAPAPPPRGRAGGGGSGYRRLRLVWGAVHCCLHSGFSPPAAPAAPTRRPPARGTGCERGLAASASARGRQRAPSGPCEGSIRARPGPRPTHRGGAAAGASPRPRPRPRRPHPHPRPRPRRLGEDERGAERAVNTKAARASDHALGAPPRAAAAAPAPASVAPPPPPRPPTHEHAALLVLQRLPGVPRHRVGDLGGRAWVGGGEGFRAG
jgi:hypothetical protein